eukprot:6085798-Prymnesium_polylepis.1
MVAAATRDRRSRALSTSAQNRSRRTGFGHAPHSAQSAKSACQAARQWASSTPGFVMFARRRPRSRIDATFRFRT